MLPVASPTVIYRSLPDGAVLFSTVDEVYFGLNTVAARIWELLPPVTQTFDELCATLEQQYPEIDPSEIRSDARKLLEDLVEAGLARPGAEAGVTEQHEAEETARA